MGLDEDTRGTGVSMKLSTDNISDSALLHVVQDVKFA